jgi:hypothetical protein
VDSINSLQGATLLERAISAYEQGVEPNPRTFAGEWKGQRISVRFGSGREETKEATALISVHSVGPLSSDVHFSVYDGTRLCRDCSRKEELDDYDRDSSYSKVTSQEEAWIRSENAYPYNNANILSSASGWLTYLPGWKLKVRAYQEALIALLQSPEGSDCGGGIPLHFKAVHTPLEKTHSLYLEGVNDVCMAWVFWK